MKRIPFSSITVFVLAIVFTLLISGCARVNYGLSSDRKIQFDRAGGYSSPERGLEVLAKQSDTETKILLDEKLRAAIKSADPENVRQAVDTIKLIYSDERNVLELGIRNSATCRVKILSAPFRDLQLDPGEESFKKDFLPDSIYELRYIEYRDRRSAEARINILLEAGRTTPITIRDK